MSLVGLTSDVPYREDRGFKKKAQHPLTMCSGRISGLVAGKRITDKKLFLKGSLQNGSLYVFHLNTDLT